MTLGVELAWWADVVQTLAASMREKTMALTPRVMKIASRKGRDVSVNVQEVGGLCIHWPSEDRLMSEGMRVSHFATGLCVAFGFSSDHYAIQAMTDLLPIIDWQGLTNEQRTRELCERVAEIAARWGGRVDTGRSAPVDLVTINPLDKESATT